VWLDGSSIGSFAKPNLCSGKTSNYQHQILISTKQLNQQQLSADGILFPHLRQALIVSGNIMETPNINGKWTGTIIYGEKYADQKGQELYFDMDIIQEGELINGISVDVGGKGISPDSATVSGTFKTNIISFIKRYDSLHYFNKGKTVVDKSKPGHEIYYTGLYNETNKTFKGDWEYRVRYKILWIFPYTIVAGGTWNMHHK